MPDQTATLSFEVAPDDTASALGSGSLPVLATPRLLAWLEAATCAALAEELAEGETSVGTRVELQHSVASPVGQIVQVTASTTYADGRLRRFSCAARHVDDGVPAKVVATAEITRVVVDSARFLDRLRHPNR